MKAAVRIRAQPIWQARIRSQHIESAPQAECFQLSHPCRKERVKDGAPRLEVNEQEKHEWPIAAPTELNALTCSIRAQANRTWASNRRNPITGKDEEPFNMAER